MSDFSIITKPAVFDTSLSADDLVDLQFEVEIYGYHLYDSDDGEDRWECRLYRGDSNAPWKSGTLSGNGYGPTIGDAVKKAIENLKESIGFIKDGKETRY